MADSWEFECPQFIDFNASLSEHESNESWFEVDHEADHFESMPIVVTNSNNIIMAQAMPVNIAKPAVRVETITKTTTIKKEAKEQAVENDARSALNNKSNMCGSVEEFHRNVKNKPPGRVPGKENLAKKGPGRVIRTTHNSGEKTEKNQGAMAPPKKPTRLHETKPAIAKAAFSKPISYKHRRSLSAGCHPKNGHAPKNLAASSKMRSYGMSTDKLNAMRSVSTEKLSAIRSVSTEKLNARRSISTETLNARRSVSTEKLNARRSVSTDKLNARHSASTGKLNAKRTMSSEKLNKCWRSSASSLNSDISESGKDDVFSSNKSSCVPKLKGNHAPNTLRPNKQMTSEELELEKLAVKRKNVRAVIKMSGASLRISQKSKGYVPITSNKKPTVPKGYEFKSDKRLRTRSVEYVKSPINDLGQILRKEDKSYVPNGKPLKRTIVQPFKLTASSREKPDSAVEKFETLAEQIRKFSNKTPDRFRTRSKENREKPAWSPPRCTIARTPNLTCKLRSRPVHILSTQELEELELEEIQKQQFKARDINRKIFQSTMGVKEVPKREQTILVPFDMPGSKIQPTRKPVVEEAYEFHARPIPSNILDGVVGLRPVERQRMTVPESPAFALKQRMQRPVVEEPKQENIARKIKARPYVHSGVKFALKLEHRSTVSEPFTFDERLKEDLVKKEQKIQKLIEEKTKVIGFSANPIPEYNFQGLPIKRSIEVTKPYPFKLQIEERVEKRIEEKQHQLEEEAKLQDERMRFKAQPCDIVNKAPFVPQLDHKCTLDVAEFTLYTETRHGQRQQFEEKKKAREAELQSSKLEAERLKLEEEDREVYRQRAESVHKANPIKHYKPVEIQHNIIPLTVPVTPNLSSKKRVRTASSLSSDI